MSSALSSQIHVIFAKHIAAVLKSDQLLFAILYDISTEENEDDSFTFIVGVIAGRSVTDDIGGAGFRPG
jgi:hypothetical protein